jgi:hypothetical protein
MKGDLDDEVTLRRELVGVWGVFSVQNSSEAGVEREEAQGKRLATLARECNAGGARHCISFPSRLPPQRCLSALHQPPATKKEVPPSSSEKCSLITSAGWTGILSVCHDSRFCHLR